MLDPHDVPFSKTGEFAPLHGEGPVASNIVHDPHIVDPGNQVIGNIGEAPSGTTGVSASDPVTGARYPIGTRTAAGACPPHGVGVPPACGGG